MLRKAWHDLAHQDRVHLDLDQDLKAENLDQVVQDQPVPEEHVPDLDQRNQDWVAEHREVFQVALQLAEEVAELAAVQLVLLVKAAQEDNLRPENQSAPREKNSNLEVFQVLVEQLFQEEMAQQ
jgi:DhnA family fructose-bisphosphate aldolase class Ia